MTRHQDWLGRYVLEGTSMHIDRAVALTVVTDTPNQGRSSAWADYMNMYLPMDVRTASRWSGIGVLDDLYRLMVLVTPHWQDTRWFK